MKHSEIMKHLYECEQCCLWSYGDRYTPEPCSVWAKLKKEEEEERKMKRLIAYCRMMAVIERREKEEQKKKEEEQERKKKRFYNFLFYASLLFILVLKLKWDIKNYLNPNLFL